MGGHEPELWRMRAAFTHLGGHEAMLATIDSSTGQLSLGETSTNPGPGQRLHVTMIRQQIGQTLLLW